ncbi:hypothetical protein B0H34DRAFT_202142 [Crassisporium funariophilum]|nr:hypothetical protein B0H34DRAFT_202142 [Crassisporium funariophilum]
MQTQQQRLEPRVLKYGGGHGHAHHGQQHHSHSHSRSASHSSQSSLDVDEMLLRATTGDEHAGGGAGTPNGSGTPYVDSPHHHHLGRSSTMPHRRSRGDRDGESPRPHSNGPHPGITTATNPYPPQHPSNAAYPANQSAPAQPAMSSLRGPGGAGQQAGGEGRTGQVIQTHIFAPVVTGAPIKKPKFPNTIGVGSASLGGSGPSLETPPGPGSITTAGAPAPAPTAVPFASTNAQGQRICRQCGMVGRYKDGKCVEKWGPGPMGPGTVCDRCVPYPLLMFRVLLSLADLYILVDVGRK